MKITTIDDLPNELLDEIFAYLYPVIPFLKGRLVNTVCRRWNRPFMTTRLEDYERIPDHVNLQLICPRLASMTVYMKDLANFKGHACLKELSLLESAPFSSDDPESYSFILSNCPRLIRFKWWTKSSILFNDQNFAAFMILCQSLTHLYLNVKPDVNMNDKMVGILNARNCDFQGLVNLKTLSISVSHPTGRNNDPFDLGTFYSLFQAPFLEHVNINNEFNSAEEQTKVLSLFPMVSSIALRNVLAPDNTRASRGIYNHVTDLKISSGIVSLVSIQNQFPNLVSLDTDDSEVLFDVVNPTRISILKKPTNHPPLKSWMFPCLSELECIVSSENCNDILRDLGLNCPQLVKLSLRYDTEFDYDDIIDPDFGSTTFPHLTTVKLLGGFVLNESFTLFIARHPKLVSLSYESMGNYQEALTFTDSEMILWPNLVDLRLRGIGPEIVIPRLHWFLKNAPNLVHLAFDMGEYEPTGNESEIAFYCPNLKSLEYRGNLSGESLRNWTGTGNWSRTLKKLFLKIKFKPADLFLLFQFLGTLSRTDDICIVSCHLPCSPPESEDVLVKKYLEPCPEEWKSIVIQYCDFLVNWTTWNHTHGDFNKITMSPKSVLQKVVPYSGAKIVAEFSQIEPGSCREI